MADIYRKNKLKLLKNKHILKKEIKHAFTYLILSSLGGFVECGIFFLLSKCWFGVVVANIIGFLFWLVTSFTLNIRKNFEKQDFIKIRFAIYLMISVVGLVSSTLLVYLFIQVLWYSVIVSKFLQIIIMAIPLYMANRLITFGNFSKIFEPNKNTISTTE